MLGPHGPKCALSFIQNLPNISHYSRGGNVWGVANGVEFETKSQILHFDTWMTSALAFRKQVVQTTDHVTQAGYPILPPGSACDRWNWRSWQLEILLPWYNRVVASRSIQKLEVAIMDITNYINALHPGASEWTAGPRLPRAVQDAKAVNSGGKIYLAGGQYQITHYQDEVQYWHLVNHIHFDK